MVLALILTYQAQGLEKREAPSTSWGSESRASASVAWAKSAWFQKIGRRVQGLGFRSAWFQGTETPAEVLGF